MVNECHIVGRLGKDPELRYTASQTPVCNFTVATDSGNKDPKTGEQITEWFKVVVWEKQAETCNMYLKKGKLVYVRGRLQTREWQTKDGTKAFSTELVAERVKFLSPKEDDGTPLPARSPNPSAKPASEPPPSQEFNEFDGIPF